MDNKFKTVSELINVLDKFVASGWTVRWVQGDAEKKEAQKS